MDDLQRLLKRNDQLHANLKALICELDDVVVHNVGGLIMNDRIERSKRIFKKSKSLINEFEASPKLLDEGLDFYIGELTSLYLKLYKDVLDVKLFREQLTVGIAELVYNFAKIRGFKTVANYFSSDVYLISQIISLMSNKLHDLEVFLNLIWLSNLVLVPFPLETIERGLSKTIFNLGLLHLTENANASKTQLVSLILLSRLITREDFVQANGLHDYLYNTVLPIWQQTSFESRDFTVNQNAKLGHMMTINKILKRVFDGEYIDFIYKQLMEPDMIQLRIQLNSLVYPQLTNLNILYMIKILSKLSSSYLRLNNCFMVSAIVNNLLNDIMSSMLDRFDSNLRYCLAKNLGTLVSNLALEAVNYQEQLVVYMVDQLEIPNVDIKMDGVQNLFQTNLVLDSNLYIAKVHTVVLFLSYVTMNKSLPKHLIPVVLSIIHKSLFFVQRRVSNQIRDSSCFVVWALCRATTKSEFTELSYTHPSMMTDILCDLIKVIIFDDDLTIRRCGIAVMQEFVGRFGTELFKSMTINQNDEELGRFIIKFIELFNNSTIGSSSASYDIIERLVDVGVPSALFVPVLLQNILDDDVNFSIQKLSSHHLVKVLQLKSETSQFSLQNVEAVNTSEKIKTLVNHISSYGAIYAISELFPLIDDKSSLLPVIEEFRLDFHHDSQAAGESYLKFVNSLLAHNTLSIISSSVWNNIFSISRFKYDDELVVQFEHFFELLKLRGMDVGEDNANQLVHYIKHNNLNLARSLPYYHFTEEILQLTESMVVECDTRAMIIRGLNENFQNNEFNEGTLTRLVGLLDDYTVTNQGDVGSKIRLSMLDLIKKNPQAFKEPSVFKLLESKLIRLAGELIDKIKYKAFHLLTGNVAEEQYFYDLFDYYKTHILRQRPDLSIYFWKGIIFSIASFSGSNKTINESFNEFLRFLGQITPQEKELVFEQCLDFLKLSENNPRDIKVMHVALNFFIKVFECGIEFPKFNYNLLFIRCFNLQLNCANLTRIGLILRIWEHMLTNCRLTPLNSSRCVKKVVSMACCHPKPKVRNMGSEVLFEIAYDLGDSDTVELLDTLDWDNLSAIKRYHKSLDHRFTQLILNT